MDLFHGNWQKIWKLLSNPAVEVAITIAAVMVATWYLIETGTPGLLPPFGKH